MIEKGRIYRAGLMKDIDPGHPNSTVPYFIKVQEGDKQFSGLEFSNPERINLYQVAVILLLLLELL